MVIIVVLVNTVIISASVSGGTTVYELQTQCYYIVI